MSQKHAFTAFSLAAAVIAFIVSSAFAQGMGTGPHGRMYNPSTETTVSGTVEQVRVMSRGGGWGGTRLDLKTDSGVFEVHLGPSSYLTSKGFTKGDKVEVTGSKQSFQGHDALIAREVKMGSKVLTLRNAQGIPEWSGGRRSGGPGIGAAGGGMGTSGQGSM